MLELGDAEGQQPCQPIQIDRSVGLGEQLQAEEGGGGQLGHQVDGDELRPRTLGQDRAEFLGGEPDRSVDGLAKKAEPLWSLLVRARRIPAMLPALEGVLSGWGRLKAGEGVDVQEGLDGTDAPGPSGLAEPPGRGVLTAVAGPVLGGAAEASVADRAVGAGTQQHLETTQ